MGVSLPLCFARMRPEELGVKVSQAGEVRLLAGDCVVSPCRVEDRPCSRQWQVTSSRLQSPAHRPWFGVALLLPHQLSCLAL